MFVCRDISSWKQNNRKCVKTEYTMNIFPFYLSYTFNLVSGLPLVFAACYHYVPSLVLVSKLSSLTIVELTFNPSTIIFFLPGYFGIIWFLYKVNTTDWKLVWKMNVIGLTHNSTSIILLWIRCMFASQTSLDQSSNMCKDNGNLWIQKILRTRGKWVVYL